MKKGTKIGLGLAALVMGAVVLSGCTNSFCSLKDKANILYAIDYGVCQYFDSEAGANDKQAADQHDFDVAPEKKKNADNVGVVGSFDVEGNTLWYYAKLSTNQTFYKVYTNARDKQGYKVPSLNYYIEFDKVVLNHAIEEERKSNPGFTVSLTNIVGDGTEDGDRGVLIRQGYLKYYDTTGAKKQKLWANWDEYNNEVRLSYDQDKIDECAQNDYIKYYKSQMNSKISASRSCLAIKDGYYGNYGDGNAAFISKKSWGYAWQKVGFFSGLLVYPIGWLIDTFATGMQGKVGTGWAALLAILFVTIIVRSLMLAATFKQTTSTSKMQELQPEIAKIQAKYPNSNTNNYEKQRLAQETQQLYKKHKINPFTSIIVMIVQFPVFICVWGAMQGSAILSSGRVLNLNLSTSISSVLTTWSNWTNPVNTGVFTALGLFLLMSGAQVVAMLLPQWIQKAEKKKIAKLGRNPAQKESDNKTKWFTYIMLGMIIFMGFSLVSALGVYWLVGALFSVAQTLITHAIMHRKKKNK